MIPSENIAYWLLLQRYPTCLVRLILMICERVCKWPYSCCFVGCCFQDLFRTARNILVLFPSSFFFAYFVSVRVVHPYSSTDTATAWKTILVNISKRSDFHIIDNLSIVVHAFTRRMLTSLSVGEILLLRFVKLLVNFRFPSATRVFFKLEFWIRFILWIELPWPENPANTYTRHTETLDRYFDLTRSHQQCIPWSPPLVIQFTI